MGNETDNTNTFFRRIFAVRPKLLWLPSMDIVLDEWLKEHPDFTEVPVNVRSICDKVRSSLRSAGRHDRPQEPGDETRMKPSASLPVRSLAAGAANLDTLELLIDDCLTLAKNLDAIGLEEVIRLLRRARNAVVLKRGSGAGRS
jgi:hypothetical protein